MEWIRDHGIWRMTSTSQKEEKAPENSTHLLWSSHGNLGMALLCDGDKLSNANRWRLDEISLDAENVIGVDVGERVKIRFESRQGKLHLFLEETKETKETDSSLIPLAAAVGATRILVQTHSTDLEFLPRGNRGWKCETTLEVEDLPDEIQFRFAARPPVRFKVNWFWRAICSGVFVTEDCSRLVELPEGCRHRDWWAGLYFNHQPPVGLTLSAKYQFEPLPATPKGFPALLTSSGDKATLRELVELDRKGLKFGAAPYSVTVSMISGGMPCGAQYYAIVDANQQIQPSVNEEEPIWSYGPPRPVHPGAGVKPIEVLNLLAHDMTKRVPTETVLRRGEIPTHLKSEHQLLLISNSPRNGIVAGVLCLSCDIPTGKWTPAVSLGPAEKVIAWRGLVGKAAVKMLTIDDKPRYYLALTKGFELDSKMWVAAAFAGVAMTRQANWWGDPRYPESLRVSRNAQCEWDVKGRWIWMDFDKRIGALRKAVIVPEATALVFLGGGDIQKATGPILEISPGRSCPILRGWLADSDDYVDTGSGKVSLTAKGTLEKPRGGGGSGVLENIEALKQLLLPAADKHPDESEGEVDGWRWRRTLINGQEDVVFEAPRDTGLYVLET